MSVLGDDLSILRQRYQALLQYHDSHASLLQVRACPSSILLGPAGELTFVSSLSRVQDLFKYSQHLESILQTETSQLQRALSNAQLDLDDAKNSRRNLQQQVSTYDNQIVQLTKETDDYKVRGKATRKERENERDRRLFSFGNRWGGHSQRALWLTNRTGTRMWPS